MLDISGIQLPFNMYNFLETIMGLLSVVNPYVLLGLAIAFAPKIIEFLKGLFYGKKTNKNSRKVSSSKNTSKKTSTRTSNKSSTPKNTNRKRQKQSYVYSKNGEWHVKTGGRKPKGSARIFAKNGEWWVQ